MKRYEEIITSSSPYKTGSSTKGKSNNMSETWKLPTKIKNSSSKMPRSMARMEIIDSPQSSYYRWLDQNPQLAFQAANKLANSPAVQQVGWSPDLVC